MRAWAAAKPSCAAVIDFDALAASEGAPPPIPNDGHHGVRGRHAQIYNETFKYMSCLCRFTGSITLAVRRKYAKAKEQLLIEVLPQPATGFWSPDGWALKSLTLHEDGCANPMNSAILQVRFSWLSGCVKGVCTPHSPCAHHRVCGAASVKLAVRRMRATLWRLEVSRQQIAESAALLLLTMTWLMPCNLNVSKHVHIAVPVTSRNQKPAVAGSVQLTLS